MKITDFQLDVDSFDEILEAFKIIDQDSDGGIECKDVNNCFATIECSKISQSRFNEIVSRYFDCSEENTIEENNTEKISKSIDVNEFFLFLIRNMTDFTNKNVQEELYENLENDSEIFTFEDLKEVIKRNNIKFTEKDLKEMMEFADVDKDGVINKNDFAHLLENLSTFDYIDHCSHQQKNEKPPENKGENKSNDPKSGKPTDHKNDKVIDRKIGNPSENKSLRISENRASKLQETKIDRQSKAATNDRNSKIQSNEINLDEITVLV